ncbi:MAG TPA: undecaprenyldiphospho-muramoylpentapeptide beta-N-acetylglucosaminyltransferase [Anaerolineales bacterium]|nr:undecaprenyldiphospho-muramoylpentapeptide beta-N-acetylglucosaminyltransferase [Anaerolineales bacterium]
MRLLICAGGTGGGVYPALSVCQAVKDRLADVLWIGGEGGMEAELVQREGIPYQAIPASAVHGVGLRTLVGLGNAVRGYIAARKIIAHYKPDAMFFTGGYVAVPVALAGRHIPTLLYVPDIEPGWALKTLARFADEIALIADDSRTYFPAHPRLVTTGHPVRRGLATWDREAALQEFGFRPDMPTLLIFGGSRGARAINRAVINILPQLLTEMQVLHLSGTLDWDEARTVLETMPAELAPRYKAFPYLHEQMGAAYTVADLVLSRAGASSVGEFPLFGLPAILVPYPHAWRYQKVNADYLTRQGAAIMLPNDELPEKVLPLVQGLMRDASRREQMRAAMLSLAQPDAAERIAGLLLKMVSKPRDVKGRQSSRM